LQYCLHVTFIDALSSCIVANVTEVPMTRLHPIFICGLLASFLSGPMAPAPQTQPVTAHIVDAANAFLSTLDASERQRVMFAFDDETQRARWSNFPTGVVQRAGISLKEMTSAQQAAVMNLLSVVLSPQGLEKVNQIRQADDAFKNGAGRNGPRGGGRGPGGPPAGAGGPPPGGRPGRGPGGGSDMLFGSDLYFVSFLGQPSTTAPWMLQFGGHHLALNITIAGNAGVLTPTLTGAQPATFIADGQTIRPIGRESDKAVTLLQSLSDEQRQQAVLSYRVADLVLGPGQDGKKILPEGLKVATLNDKQRALVLDVIAEWAGIINDASATPRMAQLKADLADTYFAWSGSTDVAVGKNITAYYRIQGPHLVIEYAPQNDDPGDHVHTMYRDPMNDYGRGK
jgi:hypothetical protein